MKKKIVLLLILLLTITVAATGCEKKKAITAEEFKKTMESKGYVIKDVNDQFEGQKVLKQVYLAIKADSSYQIEFYELTTTDAGKEFYKVNKENFEKESEAFREKWKSMLEAGDPYYNPNFSINKLDFSLKCIE